MRNSPHSAVRRHPANGPRRRTPYAVGREGRLLFDISVDLAITINAMLSGAQR